MAHTGIVTPTQQPLYVLGAFTMTVIGIDKAHFSGPSAIAVDHHADMSRYRFAGKLPHQPFLVQPVQQITHYHDRQA